MRRAGKPSRGSLTGILMPPRLVAVNSQVPMSSRRTLGAPPRSRTVAITDDSKAAPAATAKILCFVRVIGECTSNALPLDPGRAARQAHLRDPVVSVVAHVRACQNGSVDGLASLVLPKGAPLAGQRTRRKQFARIRL